MSKDRDSNDSVSGSGLRFRNQSPSTTNRRSRDRERTTNDKTWERDADANTMLITNEASITSPAVAGNISTFTATSTTTAPAGNEQTDHPMDDSRMSGKKNLRNRINNLMPKVIVWFGLHILKNVVLIECIVIGTFFLFIAIFG